jgi:hypothetical protein
MERTIGFINFLDALAYSFTPPPRTKERFAFMSVAVVGSVVVGLSFALALALQGHEVCVIEQNEGLATGNSFALGGLCSPGFLSSGLSQTLQSGDFKTWFSHSLFLSKKSALYAPSLFWLKKWRHTSNLSLETVHALKSLCRACLPRLCIGFRLCPAVC